ncbi:MAG: hypothetical protein K2M04_06635 [Muribaculaceae bacterium]|nr:hypothetical protein [Muribaculaceae bacterium]
MVILLFPAFVFADNDQQSATVILEKRDIGHKQDDEGKGRRCPARPIFCIITPDSIQSPIDPTDIISYELWDADDPEICIAAFSDQSSFLTFLFLSPANYHLRLVTNSYVYSGNFLNN